MSNLNKKESLYELLQVSSKADTSEITAAYMAAKNAFSADSVATYSLLPADETVQVLKQLEVAYHTLTNPEKRRQYDMKLASGEPFSIADLQLSQPQPPKEVLISEFSTNDALQELDLFKVRELRKLSFDDVVRITKIPPRYLKAIEEFDKKSLPAQVYVQGFLKNLAQLYRLDAKSTVSKFMDKLNRLTGSSTP